jgi:hypothetical protein
MLRSTMYRGSFRYGGHFAYLVRAELGLFRPAPAEVNRVKERRFCSSAGYQARKALS